MEKSISLSVAVVPALGYGFAVDSVSAAAVRLKEGRWRSQI